ncbi:conserved hypothetical protein [Chromobacterium violaceum ATCC 12472]|uniref:Uncharacterized protein n=1 Tax=Chromobacterium violaceum (strain ATCC 12472 / DSM 30191 / JCM 1249 / CCUG 213 / NBRC 12614 / NCIMB 9131 / NCTC 9757 / MK) TaxID=243365 RepID=Q7NS17_CHRVO|nr:conserved hypothetical protein [Chromobacterium violaceum ATCC 12472]
MLILGAALLAFGAVKFGLIYYWYSHNRQPSAPAAQVLSCDIERGACALPGGGALRFSARPSNGQPFEIRLDGVAAEAAPTADFTMPGMDMGFNRYTFLRDGAGWKAKAILPMCVSGSRDWQVELKLGKGAYRLPFRVR